MEESTKYGNFKNHSISSGKEVVIGKSNSAPITIYKIDVAQRGKKEPTKSLFRTKPYVEKEEKMWKYVYDYFAQQDKKDRPKITSESPF